MMIGGKKKWENKCGNLYYYSWWNFETEYLLCAVSWSVFMGIGLRVYKREIHTYTHTSIRIHCLIDT